MDLPCTIDSYARLATAHIPERSGSQVVAPADTLPFNLRMVDLLDIKLRHLNRGLADRQELVTS